MIKKKNGIDIEKAVKESCEKNGIILFDQLKMVCEDRQFNTLNEKSLVLRYTDIDNIEKYEDIEFFDKDDNKVLDVSLYFPSDKAYIILNRVHFGKLYIDNQKYIMKQFIKYLLSPNNFNYYASAIYLYSLGFNIKEYILNEIGFFEYGPLGTHLLCYLNTHFRNELSSILLDEITKNHILESYKSLNKTKAKYLYRIKICLANSNYALKSLLEEKRTGKIIDFHKDNIRHYEEILSNYNYHI